MTILWVEWRDVTISPFDKVCEVSSTGLVRTRNRIDCFGRRRKSRFLSQHKVGRGYFQVQLSAERKQKFLLAHRLVALAFINSDPPDGFEVNHKNGNKLDNRVENLEWVSKSENRRHAYHIGLSKGGEKHPKATMTEKVAKAILKAHKTGVRGCDLAAKYKLKRDAVYPLLSGRTWKHLPR